MKKILRTLRNHRCFDYLPKDERDLIGTLKVFKGTIRKVDPGDYLHIGIKIGILNILNKSLHDKIPDTLLIDWNSDGCRLNKKYSLWPIQI